MAVPYTTLLGYLGKHITFKVPCPIQFNQSGFDQLSGKVIAVNIELSDKHSICVLYDEPSGSADYFNFDEMIIQS